MKKGLFDWFERETWHIFAVLRGSILLVLLFVVAGVVPILPKVIHVHISVPSVIFLFELTKLLLLLLFLWLYPLLFNAYHERWPSSPPVEPVRRMAMLKGFGAWKFCVIAGLYVLVNNLKLYALLALDPGTFTLLNNLSIPFAAVLFRIVMRRKLTSYQICALIILVTGLLTSKLTVVMGMHHEVTKPSSIEVAKQEQAQSTFLGGLLVMVIASLCAAMGDVGAEFAFKEWSHSQHFVAQSISLYLYGVILNLVAIVAFNWDTLAEEYVRILEMGSTSVVVFINAINGILIGLVLRFSVGGNITKIFADAGALLLTLLLSAVILHQVPQLDVICGLVSIYMGIFIYSTQQEECERLNSKQPEQIE